MGFKFEYPANRELLGGDLLAQSLKHLGCEVAFGLHGGHLDAFLIAADEIGIRLIDVRHETVAVQAAEGYSKVRGKVGICFVTANSGFANGLPGLASAFADRSPILCITSSPPLRDAETNALQGFHDQVVLSKPITKFSHRVTNVEEIPRLIAYAYRAASTGTRGPVVLDIPIDVLFAPPRMDGVAYGALDARPAYPPAPAPQAIGELLCAWQEAKRPVIITGTGTRGSSGKIVKLAEELSSPVFYSNKYSSDVPFKHELRAGSATLLARLAVSTDEHKQPDFVLLIGARTGFLLGGRSGSIIPSSSRCTVAQVDVDGAEIGRSHHIDIGVVSDASLFCDVMLQALATAAPRHEEASASASRWIKTCSSLRCTPSPFANGNPIMPDGRLHPYHATRELMHSLPSNGIFIIDGGECGQWAFNAVETAQPQLCMVASGYLGMLGNGWGYALGAAIAEPDRQIISVHGDGSLGFHIGELDTFSRFGLKVLTVVYNNAMWGMSFNGQEIMYEGKTQARPTVGLGGKAAYEIVAEGFGCAGRKVTAIDEIKEAVEQLVKGKQPGLLNLIVSPKPAAPVTVAMVGQTEDKDVIVVPYYDNLPRPYYRK
ncbi:acetolactate synthase I/II/III large subunit [Polychaeton citri CBS 116435]|uniref:Acetolactate synthase I/II/III large subunit n=1 Tax=Polychaeton citri CBS 116435 TaxID=1314669 RepID=A0A9P4QJG7_9PEZI|nr:acetolactate synthase I/II/III large subunit [Polychaeton citri CBS 116435]